MKARRDDNRVFNELVLRLYRMLKVGSMHLPNNAAVHQAVEQCVKFLPELDGTDMRRLRLLFVDDTVYVNGRLLKADRQTFELAAELGRVVEGLGFNELTVSGQAANDDLIALAAAFHEDWTGEAEGVDLRSIDPEALASLRDDGSSSRDKLIRTYTSTVVVMRWVYESLLEGNIRAPRNLKRLVQQLAVLADEEPRPFLHIAAGPNLHDDDGGRAVKAALVAIAMGRALIDDVRGLARIGLTALLVDLGRTRAARLELPSDAPRFRVLPALNDGQLARLPASTAAILTAVGRLQGDAMERTRIAWLAQQLDVAAFFDTPSFDAPLESRIVRIARQWADALTFDVRAQTRRTPHEVYELLTRMAADEDEARVVRLLGRVLELDSSARERRTTTGRSSTLPSDAVSNPGSQCAPFEVVTPPEGGSVEVRDTAPVGDLLGRWFDGDATERSLSAEVMGPPDSSESEVLDAWFGDDDAPDSTAPAQHGAVSGSPSIAAEPSMASDRTSNRGRNTARLDTSDTTVSGDALARPPRASPPGRSTERMWQVRGGEADATTEQLSEHRTHELLDEYRRPGHSADAGAAAAPQASAPRREDRAPHRGSAQSDTTEQLSEDRTRELLDGYRRTTANASTERLSAAQTAALLDGYGPGAGAGATTEQLSEDRTRALLDNYGPGARSMPVTDDSAESTVHVGGARVRDLLASYLTGDEHDATDPTAGRDEDATVQLTHRHANRLVGQARQSSFERALQSKLGGAATGASADARPKRSPTYVTIQPPSRSKPAPARQQVESATEPAAAVSPTDAATVQLDDNHASLRIGEARQSSFERALQRRIGDRPNLADRKDPDAPRALVATPPPSRLPPPVAAERLPIQEAPIPEAQEQDVEVIARGGPADVDAFVARRREEQLSGVRDAVPQPRTEPTPADPASFDDKPPSRDETSTDAAPSSAPGGWVRRPKRKRTTGSPVVADTAPSRKSAPPAPARDEMDALLRAYLEGDG